MKHIMAVEAKLKLLKSLKTKQTDQLSKMAIAFETAKSYLRAQPKPTYNLIDIGKILDLVKEDSLNIFDAFGQESTRSLLEASRGGKIETIVQNPIDQLSVDDLEKIQGNINEINLSYTNIMNLYVREVVELSLREREISDLEKAL